MSFVPLCAYWRLCLKGENSCPKGEKRILALFVLRFLRESFYCDNIYSLEIMNCLLEIREVLFCLCDSFSPFFFGRSSLVGCFFSHRYFEVQRRDS